jgi:Family of unknown function (DUF6011)
MPTTQTTQATDKQVTYLLKLIAERYETGVEGDAANEQLALIEAASDHPMTKAVASRYIDTLLRMPRRRTAVAETTDDRQARAEYAARVENGTPHPTTRPNRYAARCARCGHEVAAEAGQLIGQPGAWSVIHADDECPETEPTPAPTVAEGHYAITSTGDNDLAFYRVEHGTGQWAGRTFVRLVVGGHSDRNAPRDHVAGILARIAADPDAAARYGREIGRCWMCNRHLTDETSRALGIGPDCRAK